MTRSAVLIVTMAAALAAGLSLSQAARSQETPTPEVSEDEESSREKIQRGWDSLLEGFQDEMAPSLEALRDWAEAAGPALESFLEEMGPALTGMMDQVRDWSAYEAPEILPNGDIIMRRKPEAGPLPPAEESGEGDDAETDGAIDI